MMHKFQKLSTIGILWLWLGIFALLPFALVLVISFLVQGEHHLWEWSLTLYNYRQLLDPVYLNIFVRSLLLACFATGLCLLIGYPFAYMMARTRVRIRSILMVLLVVPFWTNGLIRVYSIITIIRVKGIMNHVLMSIGLLHHPIDILYTQAAVLIGLVYVLLPFMILPIYATLEKMDWSLVEAARDLGAGKMRRFCSVIIPLSMPGIMAGGMLVLLPAMTMFYIPDVLGGAKSLLLGNLIKNEFIDIHNWPLGAAVSVLLTLLMGFMMMVYWHKTTAKQRRRTLV